MIYDTKSTQKHDVKVVDILDINMFSKYMILGCWF